jgi:hypothetical protein
MHVRGFYERSGEGLIESVDTGGGSVSVIDMVEGHTPLENKHHAKQLAMASMHEI